MGHGFDGERQFPFPTVRKGKGYKKALQSRSQAILASLMNMLASNYEAEIPSTEYSYYLRSMALELGRMTLAFEELSADVSFEQIRSEFLQEVVGSFIFFDDELPEIDDNVSDEQWREFLLRTIEIFFQGSTPESIKDAVELFTDEEFDVVELFEVSDDISRQFEFSVEFDSEDEQFPEDVFRLQDNIRMMVDIVKPAHTLYGVLHRFRDKYNPDRMDDGGDAESITIEDYRYDDVRKNFYGMSGWTSQTGSIEQGGMHVLQDEYDRARMGSVRTGATLTIFNGPNSGRYRIVESLGNTGGIRVENRFQTTETEIEYHVEVDRLGAKQEHYVAEEDVSDQFVSHVPLQIELDDEYEPQLSGDTTIDITATVGGTDIENVDFEWSTTNLMSVDGDTATYNVDGIDGLFVVRVVGRSHDGRQDGDRTIVRII